MTTSVEAKKGSWAWMIFIRIITILGIPVGSWIIKTTMNTDKNVAVIMVQMQSMEVRIEQLEQGTRNQENRYVDDLRLKFKR